MFIFNSNKEELFTRGSINNSEKDIYIDSFNYISKTRKFDLDTNYFDKKDDKDKKKEIVKN